MSTGVVVPVRGWSPYLAEALDSVLAEDPAEVVVVDDASDDPVALHPDHAARCRLVRRAEPGGPAAARNTGVEAFGAGIETIAFCDADDAWEPGSLAPRLAALAGAPVAFGRARIVGPDGRETGERWAPPDAAHIADAALLYEANPVPTSSVVMRRSAFAGFDPVFSPAEDWELWLRTVRAGSALGYVEAAVVRYRRHGGGLSARLDALGRGQRLLHER
ncbi:MAG: hypothetical protein QOG68_2345, partial [Solirubrobacteraceae bacterium]|nr:hypothetical protein [Solirubrobacteraceae bacterium]